MSTAAARREDRPRRGIARPVGVLLAVLIGLGGLAGAAGMGLGAIAASADSARTGYVHYGHHERDDDLPGAGPLGPR